MGIKVNVQFDNGRINRRLKNMQKPMTNQFQLEADKYVPMKKGTLRQSGTVSTDGKSVSWNTPYAHYQFIGPSAFGKSSWNYTTPGTGPRWDKQVKGNQGAMKHITEAGKRSF